MGANRLGFLSWSFNPFLQARPFDASSDASTALNGLESFTLAYKVDWPLNVVLSKATLTKYRYVSLAPTCSRRWFS